MPQDSRPGSRTIVGRWPRGLGWAWTLAGASFVACASDGNDETHQDSNNAGADTNVGVTTTSVGAANTSATTGAIATGTTVTSTSAGGTISSSGTDVGSGGATTLGTTTSGSTGGTSGTGGDLVVPPEGSYDFGSMPTSVSSRDASLAYSTFKQSHVEDCGDGLYRVRWDDPALTVSEGIGYGMLLAVANDDREVFDGFLRYYGNNL